jgi:hypothetical protein
VVLLLVAGYILAFSTIADMRLHQSVEGARGVNLHGYRGPVARQRKVEQVRILFLGGRWAFGTGLVQAETPAAYLQRNLHQRWRPGNVGLRATVVNLSGPGDGPASYLATLEDYRALDGDVLCLFDDPVRAEGAPEPWRHQSPVFRRTGYFPLLTRAFAPEAASDPALVASAARDASAQPDCATGLKPYCDGVASAIEYAVAHGMRVLAVRPPAATPEQRAREDAASALLQSRFGGRTDVRIVDLSREALLFPPAEANGRDLTAAEADRLADLMTGPMLELMRP